MVSCMGAAHVRCLFRKGARDPGGRRRGSIAVWSLTRAGVRRSWRPARAASVASRLRRQARAPSSTHPRDELGRVPALPEDQRGRDRADAHVRAGARVLPEQHPAAGPVRPGSSWSVSESSGETVLAAEDDRRDAVPVRRCAFELLLDARAETKSRLPLRTPVEPLRPELLPVSPALERGAESSEDGLARDPPACRAAAPACTRESSRRGRRLGFTRQASAPCHTRDAITTAEIREHDRARGAVHARTILAVIGHGGPRLSAGRGPSGGDTPA